MLNSMKALEHDGYEVTYLVPDGDGFVTPERVAAAVRDDTALVAVMLANNEIGTIEPVCEIASAVKAKNPIDTCLYRRCAGGRRDTGRCTGARCRYAEPFGA